MKAARNAWYRDNPENREANLAYQRQWREQNAATKRASSRRWYEANLETLREQRRAYYEENPDVFDRARQKRAKLKNGTEHVPYTRKEIFERDGGRCRLCGLELECKPHGYHIDHIVPVALGGVDTPANVQLTCPLCNRRKQAVLEGQIHLPV